MAFVTPGEVLWMACHGDIFVTLTTEPFPVLLKQLRLLVAMKEVAGGAGVELEGSMGGAIADRL